MFHSFSAGTVFIRQDLTSSDVRFWRIKTVPALKRLTFKATLVTDLVYVERWKETPLPLVYDASRP